jgi:hypothetical protein
VICGFIDALLIWNRGIALLRQCKKSLLIFVDAAFGTYPLNPVFHIFVRKCLETVVLGSCKYGEDILPGRPVGFDRSDGSDLG